MYGAARVGSIPKELGALTKLKALDLQNNKLTGERRFRTGLRGMYNILFGTSVPPTCMWVKYSRTTK